MQKRRRWPTAAHDRKSAHAKETGPKSGPRPTAPNVQLARMHGSIRLIVIHRRNKSISIVNCNLNCNQTCPAVCLYRGLFVRQTELRMLAKGQHVEKTASGQCTQRSRACDSLDKNQVTCTPHFLLTQRLNIEKVEATVRFT